MALDYLAFYERYRGLDFTALALANVYGPRQDPHGEAGVIAIFASKMLAGEAPTIFGDGNQTRDYVFVDDAVHAFALAAERGDGRLVNIGTGLETSVNGLYRMLAEHPGSPGSRRTARPTRGGSAAERPRPRARIERPRVAAVDPSRGRSARDDRLHAGDVGAAGGRPMVRAVAPGLKADV